MRVPKTQMVAQALCPFHQHYKTAKHVIGIELVKPFRGANDTCETVDGRFHKLHEMTCNLLRRRRATAEPAAIPADPEHNVSGLDRPRGPDLFVAGRAINQTVLGK